MEKKRIEFNMTKNSWDHNYIRLFTEISESLLKEPRFSFAVDTVIKSLGQFFKVDRVYLFVTRKEEEIIYLDYTNEWCQTGIDSFLGAPELTNVSFDMFPEIQVEMLNSKVMFGNVKDHPSDTFKEIMNAQSIISYLFSPIVFEGHLFGFVGFDSCSEERNWNEYEARYLMALGNLIAHRFLRDIEKNALEKRLQEEVELNNLLSHIDKIKSEILKNVPDAEIFNLLTEALGSYLKPDLLIFSKTNLNDLDPHTYTFYIKSIGFCDKSKFKLRSDLRLKLSGQNIKFLNNNEIKFENIGDKLNFQQDDVKLDFVEVIGKNVQFKNPTQFYFYSGNDPIGNLIVCHHSINRLLESDSKINIIKTYTEGILQLTRIRRNKNLYEENIRNSELKFRLISENSNDIIGIHSLDTKFKYLSPSFKKILGFEPENFINISPFSLMESDKAKEEIKKYIKSNNLKNDIPRVTLKFRAVDNSYKYLQVSFSSILKNDEIEEFVSTSRDVTNEILSSKALRQSERKFRLISANLTEIIALHDQDMNFIWVSQSIEKILGYTPEEVLGKNPLEIFETKEYKVVKTDEEKNIQTIEVQHRAKNGNFVHLEIIVSPFIDEELKINGSIAVSRDITERKQYEEKLESQRISFERLFEETLSGYIELFPQDNSVYLSPKFLKVLGYDSSENIDHLALLKKVIHADDYLSLLGSIEKHKKGLNTSPIVLETTYTHKNGFDINIMFAGQVLEWDEFERPMRIIGCNIDLTYIKTIENQLFKTQTALELVLKKTKQVVWIRNIKTNNIEYLSESAHELFEINEEDLANGVKFYFRNIHPKDQSRLDKALKNHDYQKIGTLDIEYRVYDKKNELIWLRTRGFNIARQNKDEPYYRIGITEEISNKKEVELSLAKNLQIEKALNDHKSYFISMVSHQFRTPLTIIQTNSELIDYATGPVSGQLTIPIEKYTSRIRSEVNRLTEILEDILVIEKSNKNKLSNRKTRFPILSLLESIVQDYNSNPTNKLLTLQSLIDRDYELVGDETYFRHAMINLIDNAIKYTPVDREAPKILIERKADDVIINIIDYGIGIPSDEIKRLFKPFYRGTNASSFKGSGLGLLIAKEFIESLGGKIKINSSLNEGTKIICQFKIN